MFKNPADPSSYVAPMTDELPLFPTSAPDVFRDPERATALFDAVLGRLAEIIEATAAADLQQRPTPCDAFTVGDLRRHVLAWLQFFAAAVNDVDPAHRIDPASWEIGKADDATGVVRAAAADIERAIATGVGGRVVVMSQARMAGDGVLAMALGEYVVHAWDLAVAVGRPYDVDPSATEAALAFLQDMVAPEHRGPDSGFFGAEFPAPAGATTLERLLCFAGRDPRWSPTSGRTTN
jgi:uncharacterized protein (TIGR03086 family)